MSVQATRPILEIDCLSVRYGSVPAVRELSLTVAAGEVVAIVGPNGAGKTTVLSAVMRMVAWSAGDVRLDGESLRKRSSDEVARRGIALVPEGRQIFADLTVHENLRLGMVARRSRTGAAEALDAVFEQFPIVKTFLDRPAGLLSGGQQQQLAIARAIVAEPDVLLLDEPSLGLAPTVIDTVFAALAAIRESGRTIVLVEQRAQRAIAFADRTYVLADGVVRDRLVAADATDAERLRAAYFGADTRAVAGAGTPTGGTPKVGTPADDPVRR